MTKESMSNTIKKKSEDPMDFELTKKNATTSKAKRTNPSAKEMGPSKKKIPNKSSLDITSQVESSINTHKEPKKFTKDDKGPFKIIINIKKEFITPGMKSPSNLTLAHDMTKKYNIQFETILKRGKYSWIMVFANRELANMALCNHFLSESKYELDIPWNNMFRRFIIKGIPTDLEDSYILEELKISNADLPIEEIYRFKKKIYVNGETVLTNTGTLKITIRGQTFPEKINMWGLKVNTSVFIPNIRQCYKCGQLSHTTKFCQNTSKCLRCGDVYDQSHEICDKPQRCINCEGNHATFDKCCPEIIFKKDVTQLMALRNIEFNEARRLLLPEPPPTKNMSNFPPLQQPDRKCYSSDTEIINRNKISLFEEQGTNKALTNNKINRNIKNKKLLYDSDHFNYAYATKNNTKPQIIAVSEGGVVPQPAPVSESDFKKLISYITGEFKKISQKLDDHIQNQLYVFQNVQDTPMELSEYPSQETGTGISLVEI